MDSNPNPYLENNPIFNSVKFLLCIVVLSLTLLSHAQNKYPYGKFPVRTIDKADYNNGGVQNWDIIQNNDHFIYIANNAGILEYNGSSWYKFELDNKEHPRSFDKNEQGDIFVGGQGEFSMIQYDEIGKPYSKKLSTAVDSIDFKDIWNVFCFENRTYFVARKFIFIYTADEIQTIKVLEGADIIKTARIGEKILCQINTNGEDELFILNGTEFTPVSNSEGIGIILAFYEKGVDYIIDSKGQFHVFISNGDSYKVEPIEHRSLEQNHEMKIRSAIINENIIVIGTDGDGVQIFDLNGNFIRSFDGADGLQNLRIHKSMFDQYNNLWLCNDNGISFIEMSSALTYFNADDGVTAGATEDIYFRDSSVYLVTHSDIFESKITNNRFKFEGIKVFGMEAFQVKHFAFPDGFETDIAIVNDGIYTLSNDNKPFAIAPLVYAWDLYQSKANPNLILVGLEDGVGSLTYSNGKFVFNGQYPNTSGDVRSVIEKDGKVYYTVKNDGMHLLDTTKKQALTKLPGLKEYSDPAQAYEQFTLGLFQNTIYAGTRNGLYFIENDKLKPAEFENGTFVEEQLLIHRIFNDNDEKMWMVLFHNSGTEQEKSEIGYITNIEGIPTWFSFPFNQIKDDVIFSLKKAADGIYWLGGVKGVYAYNEDLNESNSQTFSVFINRVYLNKDEEFLYHTNYAKDSHYLLDFYQNTVNFEFGANSYLGGLENQYSYYLEGEEETWSTWTKQNYAEFQRLSEGDYVFHLKALNFYGQESEEITFSFTISPPWYRTWWAYLIYVVIFILLIYIIIRLSISRVKAQNERLEGIVIERTAEIAKQNSKLEHQKAEIQEKTNDILDSIKYAERIQTAILPPQDDLNEIFEGENFVLFKPKDIVSGDFYWAERFGSQMIFAAVDCTGHGVPGAFVSIVGFNALNRTVNEFKLREPGKILDKLTELVVETFSKSESQIKDGMDIALCNIDYEKNILTFAGANNPLVFIRNGELIEYKADKQPIGEFDGLKPFTTHEIQLKKGDCIYIYSDGYADQFGGPKGKKFKGKALKDLLLNLNHLPMSEQHTKINEIFEDWKGEFEQLDDVCLIGVRI